MTLQASSNPLPPYNAGDISFLAEFTQPAGPCGRVLHLMNLLSESGTGLGEVLPDYAMQTVRQLEALLEACERFGKGMSDGETVSTLGNAYFVLNSAATVLDMTPAAMQRNNADMVGGSEKISREEVVRLSRAFRQAPCVQRVLASEEGWSELLKQTLAVS